jgi:hypothetical protein
MNTHGLTSEKLLRTHSFVIRSDRHKIVFVPKREIENRKGVVVEDSNTPDPSSTHLIGSPEPDDVTREYKGDAEDSCYRVIKLQVPCKILFTAESIRIPLVLGFSRSIYGNAVLTSNLLPALIPCRPNLSNLASIILKHFSIKESKH